MTSPFTDAELRDFDNLTVERVAAERGWNRDRAWAHLYLHRLALLPQCEVAWERDFFRAKAECDACAPPSDDGTISAESAMARLADHVLDEYRELGISPPGGVEAKVLDWMLAHVDYDTAEEIIRDDGRPLVDAVRRLYRTALAAGPR